MKYAYFDPSSALVLQLLDTDALNYAELPPATSLLELTDAQHAAAQTGMWYVVSGALTQTVPAATINAQLEAARAMQIAALMTACSNAITAGFESSALGAVHTYPASITDQQNLTASVLASMYPGLPAGWTTPFWCEDSTGVWAYVSHTAAQIQQAGQDGKAAILAALTKKQNLVNQVAAATTLAAIQAVVWS
ncbi:DUF4376 domain-containing protein [Burkholderia sp. YIM B11467]